MFKVCTLFFLIFENVTTISKRSYKALLLNFILSNNYYLPCLVITYVLNNLADDCN